MGNPVYMDSSMCGSRDITSGCTYRHQRFYAITSNINETASAVTVHLLSTYGAEEWWWEGADQC